MQTQGLSRVQSGFRAYGQQFYAAAVQASEATAAQVTAYDKGNARWQDRTGAARRGLACRVEATLLRIRLVNAHGVPYGKWLELRWQGRYAILLEALRVAAPPWLAQIAQRASGRGR